MPPLNKREWVGVEIAGHTSLVMDGGGGTADGSGERWMGPRVAGGCNCTIGVGGFWPIKLAVKLS